MSHQPANPAQPVKRRGRRRQFDFRFYIEGCACTTVARGRDIIEAAQKCVSETNTDPAKIKAAAEAVFADDYAKRRVL